MSLFIRRMIVLSAGIVAGLLAWPFTEAMHGSQAAFPSYLLFMVISGALYGTCFGLAFGSVDGITGGVSARKWMGLATGAVAGLVAGGLGALVGQTIYLGVGQQVFQSPDARPMGFVVARGLGWAMMGVIIGLIEGLRFRSGKRAAVGALGGLTGGLLGGLLIEYGMITIVGAWWVRPAGSILLGLLLAAGFAAIERTFLLGTLSLVTGPLRGREYPLPPGRTTIGNSIADTISLMPYADLSARHAVIIGDREGLRLERGGEGRDVGINEEPVDRADLKYDDVIHVGSARFYLKRP
jgi:hypothetical protein